MDIVFVTDHPTFTFLSTMQPLLSLYSQCNIPHTLHIQHVEYALAQTTSKPTLFVLNIWFSRINGFDLCQFFVQTYPHAYVLFCTQYETPAILYEASQRGAVGLCTPVSLDHLYYIIPRVIVGDSLWTEGQQKQIRLWRTTVIEYLTQLTGKERDIATCLALRLTNLEIANRLNVSERTIEGHVSQILNKWSFKTRLALAQWGEQIGWAEWLRFQHWLQQSDV